MAYSKLDFADPGKALTREEVETVYKNWPACSFQVSANLTIFALTVGCGLRISEVQAVRISDIRRESTPPYVRVRKGKGGRQRSAPLHWDKTSYHIIVDQLCMSMQLYLRYSTRHKGEFPLFPRLSTLEQSFAKGEAPEPMALSSMRRRWKTAVKCLGRPELSSHCGRHTFISHSLNHKSLPEVMRAVGHTSLSSTTRYAGVVDSNYEFGSMY